MEARTSLSGDVDSIRNTTERIPFAVDVESSPDRRVTISQNAIITDPATHNSILSVMAGPGSGKTFTLTRRISHLIDNHQINPKEILVLSMANKSVRSIQESLTESLGAETTNMINVSTFHSFCAKIVDINASQYLPHLQNRYLIDDLSWKYASSILLGSFARVGGHAYGGHLTHKAFDQMVAEVRGERLSTSDAAKKYKVNNEYVDALMEYLDTAGIIRYHDLVDNAAKLIDVSLAKNEFIEQLFNYKVVVVDEFQDMYQGLMTIIEKVVKYPTRGHALNTTKHLCIAGDPNQSIYEFLGSKPEMMKVIEHHFPEFPEFTVKHSVIKESFRCTPEVLKCAVEVCVPQSDVLSRSIHSVKESSHPPVIKEFKSPSEEYQFIIQEIIRLCCESGGMFKLSDFAVLARSNKEIEDFGSILANNYGIKSNKLNSSLSWIKSKVQIMLSLLNALERTSGSELPLLCILMFLDTEFGSKARISKIFSLSRTWGREEGLKTDSLEDYLIANSIGNVRKGFAIETVYKTSRHKKIIKRFNTFLESIGTQRQQLAQNYASQTPEMVLQSLLFMIENSVLKDYLNTPTGIKKSTNEADLDALRLSYTKELNEHLKEFELSLKSSYSHYQSKGVLEATGDSFVKHFLRNYNEEVLNNSPDTVNISTIHASKGLEFPIVFVIGTSPYTRGSWDALLTSDEHTSSSMARLLYVAMTRAKNLVYLGSGTSIADLSPIAGSHFTTQLPKFNDDMLKRLSIDLSRSVPNQSRLNEGIHLLNQFKPFRQVRTYHNLRKFMPASRICISLLRHK